MSAAALVCEGADSAYFGFGDPEVHACQEPATHVVKYGPGPWEPYGGRARVCVRHGRDAGAEPGVRVYRFRRVG